MSGCSVTPNDFPTGSDSRRIQMAVDRASQTGCNYVVIPPCNSRTGTNLWEIDETIELPSHICVEIRGAHLRMCDGVFCQMFRNRNAFLDVGRTPEGMQEDIILRGVGRAVLDGGRHNGLREKMSLKDGLPHIVNNLTVFKEKYCRNIADTKLCSQVFTLFNIALADSDLAIIGLSQLSNDRSYHTAGTAPCCPEIYY